MSVNTTTIAFIGKQFDDEKDAFYFLKSKNFFKDKSAEELNILEKQIEIQEISLGEILVDYSPCNFPSPSAEYLNFYTCEGFFIGYLLSIFDMRKNNKQYIKEREKAQENWGHLFKENGEEYIEIQVR